MDEQPAHPDSLLSLPKEAGFHRASVFRMAMMFHFQKQMRWVRLLVDNPERSAVDMVLAGQFSVGEMRLVEANAPLLVHQTGYLLGRDADMPSMFPALNLTVQPGRNIYYIGANPHGHLFYLPLLALYRAQAFHSFEKTHQIFFAAALGAFIVVILLNNLLAFALAERSIMYPALLALAYLCFESVASPLSHLLPPWLAGIWVNLWPAFCAFLLVMMLLASRHFFGEAIPERSPANRIIRYCILICLIYPWFHQVAPRYLGPAFIAFNALGYLVPLWIGIAEARRSHPNAPIFLTAYTLIVLIAITVIYQMFGNIPFDISFIEIRVILAVVLAIVYSLGYCAVLNDVRLAHQSLRSGLKGIIAEGQVDRVLKEGKLLADAPLEQRGTVVFIEICGFSSAAIQHSPEKSFAAQREIIGKISTIIHRNDGIVDKSLGDGLICIFGHDVVGIGGANHEERAVTSAFSLQRINVAAMEGNPQAIGQTLFPLRIGINTDTICIGNIGDADRFEIALCGNGVVLAKRFEEACEPHKVMLGRETFAALPLAFKPEGSYFQRFVPIKHQDSLEAAYEFDPFADQPATLSHVRELIWNASGASRESHRYQVGLAVIELSGEYGPVKVLNFSDGGMCLRSDTFLGKGVLFDIILKPIIGHDRFLQLIDPLKVEVMWGAPSERGGFDLGVIFLGINDAQKSRLLGALKRHLAARCEQNTPIGF